MKKLKLTLCTFLLAICIPCFCLGFMGIFANRVSAEELENLVDFTVEVKEDRDIRVLQLTDPQIIASEYQRYAGRGTNWMYLEYEKHEKYVEQIIKKYNPDLIIITGDVVYGEFDDSGYSLLRYIRFMDSFKIPWAPVSGNHDWESHMGADWMCEQYEKSEYCLFKQRSLTGNGNYTVGVTQGGELKRVFFMLDSNCSGASLASLANGHTKTTVGFGDDQIEWYTETAKAITKASPNTKLSFAFHIQLKVFGDAYANKYNYSASTIRNNPIDIDKIAGSSENSEFGYIGRELKTSWDDSYKVWNGLKALGVDSIFVGHEHCNSASVVYQGVRLQYGQKSSTYDRANYLNSAGNIVGSYNDEGDEIVGGTAIPVSKTTGEIVNPYIVYWEPTWVETPDVAETIGTKTFDFNGTDFDMTVNTPDVSGYGKAAVISSGAPEGYTGSVASCSNSYINAFGFSATQDIYFGNVTSIKLRLYITSFSPTANTSLRLYNSAENAILGSVAINTSDFGKWIEIELLSAFANGKNVIVKNGLLQDFSIVYRTYGASGNLPTVYFDSISFGYSKDLSIKPEGTEETPTIEELAKPQYTEAAWSVYDNQEYKRYTLSDFGLDNLSLGVNESKIIKVGKEGLSLNFTYKPVANTRLSIVFACNESGQGGKEIKFYPESFDITAGKEFSYAFEMGKTYGIEVGLVKMYHNEKTGQYNGNQSLMFVKVNGDMGAYSYTKSGGKYFFLADIFDCKDNEFVKLMVTTPSNTGDQKVELKSIPVVEYRSQSGALLMKEMARSGITISKNRLTYYAGEGGYTGATIDGVAYNDKNTHVNATKTVVVLNLKNDPQTDLFTDNSLKSITGAVATATGGEYNGQEYNNVSVTLGGKTLVSGVDYTLKFYRGQTETTDIVSAGEIIVKVIGKGTYGGEISTTFTINKKNLTITAKDYNLQYGESIVSNVDKITLSGLVSGDQAESIVLSRSNCNVIPSNVVIKNASGVNVTENYNITYVNGESHAFGEWEVTVKPTTTEQGLKTSSCSCGEKLTQDIPVKETPKTNVALIAGIVAGVVVVAVAVAIVVAKKKKK